ncbi:MAG: hypothetical protein EA358_06525 [Flavobacteriales bacterium]|nr:MAG: hypothetical protein EA358_06525 [Flavobacteriales bacterium]
MSRILKYLFAIFGLIFVLSGCEKENDFSVIPFLKYVGHEFTLKDGQRFIKVELYFNDRDGDIGLDQGDTLPPFDINSEYFNNLWVKGFSVFNGEIRDTFLGFDGRIPNLTPQGQNKSLEGNIFYELSISAVPPGAVLKYEFILIDRALNRSDPVMTPEITIE